jgi:biopolymer transport protein ExbD
LAIDFERLGADNEVLADVSGMNITPLIDVLLVLLVMLIMTIPVQWQSVAMELPGAAPKLPADPPAVIELELEPGGLVLFNGVAVPDRDSLLAQLRAGAALPIQPEVHIHVQAHTPYDLVAAVLTATSRTGFEKVGFVGLAPVAP